MQGLQPAYSMGSHLINMSTSPQLGILIKQPWSNSFMEACGYYYLEVMVGCEK